MGQFFKNRSLRHTTLLGSLICALLPAIVLAYGSILAIQSWTLREEINRGVIHARSLALLLEQELTDEMAGVAMLGRAMSHIAQSDTGAITQLLAAHNELHDKVDVVMMADATGLIRAAHPAAGPDGASPVGTQIADREYFRNTLVQKKTIITRELLVGRTSGKSVIIIASPAYGRDGSVIGAIIATLWVRDLQDEVAQFAFGETGHAGVMTEAGTVIAHPNADLVNKRTNFSRLPVSQALVQGEFGALEAYRDETGAERVGGFATVPSVGWKVWASRTTAEVDRIIVKNYLADIVWVLAAIIVALVVGYLATKQIVSPIVALRETAVRIADGDLESRAPVSGPKEIVELSRSVNKMADELAQNIAKERTINDLLERTVGEYATFAANVADGNLAARVSEDQRGPLGQLAVSLNRMTADLERMVGEIREAIRRLASASAEILAATSQQVSATAEEATAVRQTAATVAEVRQAAELAARKSRSVADVSQKMAKMTDDGRRSVEDTILGVNESRQRMEALAERILAFSEQAEAIAEINATVSELAEQSNLLAVNASIEAAKAGETGKGFSVVAAEVKALAERSKEATTQVRRIVIDLQKSAQSTVVAAEQGVKATVEGLSMAQRSGASFNALSGSVTEATQATQQIIATAQQQEAGMDQIALAMANIEQSSTQTVAAMRQVESAARDLNELAQRLSNTVQTSLVTS
ncbi:methyl-accepting chemotaxis protein [Ferrovibrio sp.]|uniref:methyl-accepting chemotaxis protein n=1 Tax=Ferrovibrio sp. TaxID=1917215 RepID=UPI003D1438D5